MIDHSTKIIDLINIPKQEAESYAASHRIDFDCGGTGEIKGADVTDYIITKLLEGINHKIKSLQSMKFGDKVKQKAMIVALDYVKQLILAGLIVEGHHLSYSIVKFSLV